MARRMGDGAAAVGDERPLVAVQRQNERYSYATTAKNTNIVGISKIVLFHANPVDPSDDHEDYRRDHEQRAVICHFAGPA